MTGTPMMNTIDELYPLICFLDIPPYNDWSRFNQEFGKPLRANHSETRKRAMQRVQVLLKSLMLRRQKDSLVDGQIVCKLPPKHLSKEAVEFSDDELVVYKALENKAQITLNKYIKEDRVSGKYIRLFLLPRIQTLTLLCSQLRKYPCAPPPLAAGLLPPTSHQGLEPAGYREHRRRRFAQSGTRPASRSYTSSKDGGRL